MTRALVVAAPCEREEHNGEKEEQSESRREAGSHGEFLSGAGLRMRSAGRREASIRSRGREVEGGNWVQARDGWGNPSGPSMRPFGPAGNLAPREPALLPRTPEASGGLYR